MAARHDSAMTRDVVCLLADHIVATSAGRVGIDGVDGSGKTVFGAALAAALNDRGVNVALISTDDFHHVRSVRHRLGAGSPEGYWLDSHDYDSLRTDVLHAFAPGGSRRYRPAAHDLATDLIVEGGWITAPSDTVLVVEGVFLHRDSLVDHWDFSIFLEVPFTETARRMALRDGFNPDPEHPSMRRYVEGQRIYLRACSPRDRATVVVDNTDPAAPFITKPGSGLAHTSTELGDVSYELTRALWPASRHDRDCKLPE